MNISRKAQAGSDSKGDVFVEVSPLDSDDVVVNLEAKGIIKKQFGPHIADIARQAATRENVKGIEINIKDNGALDFAIRGRVRAAIRRGM